MTTSAPRERPIPDRVDRHAALFNTCQRSGRWDDFVATFAEDAEMRFVGVPAGPFHGREAILAAYLEQPPDDTMTIDSVTTDGATDRVRFRWDEGGAGTMTVTWRGDLVAVLEVAFD
ncbi:nuclear transport factor 2 family protein [Nocardioides luteus]|uniref:nuclear transport factor 2 family protein n=1 Tax=Nocardioides luteus TaxID=1844 RepID=UPI0018CA60BC|nr:nuclear transport factor 2 family protein [Nocardioides luteus]